MAALPCRWSNKYYHMSCAPGLHLESTILDNVIVDGVAADGVDLDAVTNPGIEETPLLGMSDAEADAEERVESSKFTSAAFRLGAVLEVQKARKGLVAAEPPEKPGHVDVMWTNKGCELPDAISAVPGLDPGVCPHPTTWFFTESDAIVAQACRVRTHAQFATCTARMVAMRDLRICNPACMHALCSEEGVALWRCACLQAADAELDGVGRQVRDAYRSFLNETAWDDTYRSAYLKMVTMYGRFSNFTNILTRLQVRCAAQAANATQCGAAHKAKQSKALRTRPRPMRSCYCALDALTPALSAPGCHAARSAVTSCAHVHPRRLFA